jgi:hypothetical protein
MKHIVNRDKNRVKKITELFEHSFISRGAKGLA